MNQLLISDVIISNSMMQPTDFKVDAQPDFKTQENYF